MRPGLDRIRRLLDAMGSPEASYPVIHVAGTNGKSSTVHLAAAIVAAHGLGVGSFTSPPLLHPEEHFAVGGEQMAAAALGPALADVVPFVELAGDDATEFEVLTALAFAWFVERAVDAAVVEAGLGGAGDATNVVQAEVAVLTGVALDHAEALGGSLAAIAAEKAGIVHRGATLVSGPLPAEAEAPVAERVAATGASWRSFGQDVRLESVTQAVGGWVVDVDGVYERYEDLFLPLHGRHQVRNLALAVAGAEELLGRGLDPEAVRSGVRAVRVPGRLEVVGADPVVILDVAHNPDGIAALRTALAEEFLPTEWVVVLGGRRPRDPAAMLAPLRGAVARLFVTEADDPLAIPAAALAEAGEATLPGVAVERVPTVADALRLARDAAPREGGILVTGSHSIVGEARVGLAD